LRAQGIHALARDLCQLHGREIPRLHSRFQPGHIEQIEDELAHALDARDGASHHVAPGFLIADHTVQHRNQVALDRAQWRLQFVHENADQLETCTPLLGRQLLGLPAKYQVARGAADDGLDLVGRKWLG